MVQTIISNSAPSCGHSVNINLSLSLSSVVFKEWRGELSPTGNIQSWTAHREPWGHTGGNMQGTHIMLFLPAACWVSSTVQSTILHFYQFLDQKAAPSLYLNLCTCLPFFQGYSVILSFLLRSFLRWLLMWCLTLTISWATDRTVRRTTALRLGWWTTKRSAVPTYWPYCYHGPTDQC